MCTLILNEKRGEVILKIQSRHKSISLLFLLIHRWTIKTSPYNKKQRTAKQRRATSDKHMFGHCKDIPPGLASCLFGFAVVYREYIE